MNDHSQCKFLQPARAIWNFFRNLLPHGWLEYIFSLSLYAIDRRKLQNKRCWRECEGKDGVDILGYFEESTGLGEAARQLRDAIATILEVSSHPIMSGGNSFLSKTSLPPVTQRSVLWHLNGHIAVAMIHKFGIDTVARRFNVGCWFWEVEEFPSAWRPALNYFNEIWAFSSFNAECFKLEANGRIEVHRIPQAVTIHPECGDWREHFAFPADKTICLVVFDFGSNIERKNPFASIQAARIADAEMGGGSIHIVVKTSNGKAYPNEMRKINEALAGIGHTAIHAPLSRREMTGLYQASDIIINLHRSEGFGLVPAEAMSLGKPVVATDWSGTVDFVHKENAWPVGFKLVTNKKRSGYYAKGIRWAEADVHDAAKQIMDIILKKELREMKTEAAKIYLAKHYSKQATAIAIQKRLDSWRELYVY